MHYDEYDPYGFSPGEEDVKIKKKIRKKRTMASIHQYKALSNIINTASPKHVKTLESVDKELHKEGVRPGQVWVLPYGGDVYHLAFIGYHEKGFLMINLRALENSPVPTISLFKYPRKMKMDLLEKIKDTKATMLSCVAPTLVDEYGEALYGREMDVTLAALMVRPAFWHDHDTKKDYFLSICKEGHHRVSAGYLPSGDKCDHFCFNAAHTEPMALLSDIIFDKIYYGKNNISTFKLKSSKTSAIEPVTTSWTLIESIYESVKIIGANKAGVRRNKFSPEGETDPSDWRAKTRQWLNLNEIRSGQIYSLTYSPYRSKEETCDVRMHIKSCGYLHAELANNLIFTGVTDSELLKKVTSSTKTPELKLGKKLNIKLDRVYPFIKCPHCNSKHPVMCISEKHLNDKKYKSTEPAMMKIPEQKRMAMPGDIVKVKGDTAMYLKKIPARHSGEKIMIMTKNRKFTNVPKSQVKRIPKATYEQRRNFVDENNLLIKSFQLEHWHKLIIPGTKLKIRPAVTNPNLKGLSGFNVTVTNYPFVSGDRPAVNIIESDSLVYLDTDVTTCKTYPIEKDMHLQMGDRNLVISIIDNGSVILSQEEDKDCDDIKVSEAAIHLALSRNKLSIVQSNTVDKLLAELSE